MSSNIVKFSNVNDQIDHGGIWNPALIDTITWFDAGDISTITEEGGSVTQWDDKSGNGHHATQDNSIQQPTYDSVNKEIVLDGTNDCMEVGNNTVDTDPWKDLQQFAAITVARFDTFSQSYQQIIGWNTRSLGGGGGWALRQNGGTANSFSFNRRLSDGTDDFNVTSTPTDSDFIGVGFRDSTNANIRFNGTDESTILDGGSIGYGGDYKSGIGAWMYGDNWGNQANYMEGGIKEIIVIENTNLSDIQKVEGYLAWKWGLQGSLDVSHPYKDNRP